MALAWSIHEARKALARIEWDTARGHVSIDAALALAFCEGASSMPADYSPCDPYFKYSAASEKIAGPFSRPLAYRE